MRREGKVAVEKARRQLRQDFDEPLKEIGGLKRIQSDPEPCRT